MKNFYKFKTRKAITETVFSKSLLQAQKAGITPMLTALATQLLAHPINPQQSIELTLDVTATAHNELPGFDEIFTHIESLAAQDSYTGGIVAQMDRWQQLPNVQALTITATNVQLPQLKKAVRRELMAGSELNIAYYQTMQPDATITALQSWVALFDHELDGQIYGGKGKLRQGVTPSTTVFTPTTPGMRIVIPCVRKSFTESQALIATIFEHFWLAILKQKLVLTIIIDGKREIFDETTLRDMLINYREAFLQATTGNPIQAAQYLQTYKGVVPHEIKFTNQQDAQFNAYVTVDHELGAGRVGIFDGNGLKLVDYQLPKSAIQGYNVVLVANQQATQIIKELVNARGTKLALKNVPNGKNRTAAKAFLEQLNAAVAQLIVSESDWQQAVPLSPAQVLEMAMEQAPTGITQQELGPYLAERQALQAHPDNQYHESFKINLMLGGRYSNRFAWDKMGINAWTQGDAPCISQIPSVDLGAHFPTNEVVTLYTPEGTKLTAQLTGAGMQARLDFIEGNIYEYVRRSLKLAPATVITLTDLKRFGTTALSFERLDACNYALKFGK